MGLVDLPGADAEVEQHAADLGHAEVLDHLAELVEAGLADADPVTERRQAGRRGRDGVGVPVDADQREGGVGVEDGGGVAPVAQGGVHVDPRRGRGEHLHDALDHDGVVDGGEVSGRRHRPRSVR